MTMIKLLLQPGIMKDATRYGASGGWWDSDFVRFRLGRPETMGGWEKVSETTYLGSCRFMHEWASLSADTMLGLGTNIKFYILFGSAFYDITPVRKTVNPMANNPFASNTATNSGGFTTLTVTDNNHGAVTGDFVTFSGAATFNGIAAASINTELEITQIIDGNSYKVVVSGTASGSSSGGGAVVVAIYQINVGVDTTTEGTGWGAGPWGGAYLGAGTDTGWGEAASTTVAGQQIGLWSGSNYGEDLIYARRNGGIYYWDWSTGYAARGVNLTAVSGATTVPTKTVEVTVSQERHIIAFGCDPFDNIGTQDKALIRWGSKETLGDWLPTNTNSAGDLRLILGSTFVTHVHTSQEILVWSNTSLHSMRYVGAPFYYGISVVSSKSVIIGPKAKVVLDDTAYWMGRSNFYRYSGRAEILPCTVLEYVFDNINTDQSAKVYGASNAAFSEVMWFYCSSASQEVDKCVIYNVADNAWYTASLARTAWMDRVSQPYPTAAGTDSTLYAHDTGYLDTSTAPATTIPSYIESAPIEIADGEKFMFVNRIIPDLTFRDSPNPNAAATITLTPQDWPGGALGPSTTSSDDVVKSTTVTVERFTDRLDVRLRGRMMSFRIDTATTDTSWRLGVPRLEGKADGAK
jgi:hypothetical protein